MNQLLDRFWALEPRQRLIVIGAGIVLLIVGYLYFVYLPRSERIQNLKKDLEVLRQDRDRKQKLAADLAEAKETVRQLEAELEKASAQLPQGSEIPDLLTAISSVGRQSGLEIVQFRKREEQFKDFYAEVPVEMLVRGNYFQLERFLQRIRDLERIVNVRDLSIRSPNPVPSDPVRLETACFATTFRFLSEQERARIAQQRAAAQKGKKR